MKKMLYALMILICAMQMGPIFAAEEAAAEPVVVAQAGAAVDESSAGGEILNPYPGEEIVDRQPMVGVKLPQPDTPLDPTTIKIFIDGEDVTAETQVSVEYIFYVPSIPMKMGSHNVRLTYSDINGAALDPLSWTFNVVAKKVEVQKPTEYGPPVTNGRLVLQIADINLDNASRGSNWAETDIKYQESVDTTANLSFMHKFYGKSLRGSYERTVEQITGRTNDWAKFEYLDDENRILFGDTPITSRTFTPMTITGVKLRGFMHTYMANPKYDFTTFWGRTQEPHNGRYKRFTLGMKVDTSTSKNNKVKVILLNSKETGQSSTTSVPNHDTLASISNDFRIDRHWNFNGEMVYDKHQELGLAATESGEESALKYTTSFTTNRIQAQLGRRTIGPRFTPTTLGAFTEADREGTFGSIQYRPSQRFLAKTFYDAYHNNLHHNNNTNDYTDRSQNSITTMNLDYPRLPVLNARYGKLYTKTDAPFGNPDTQRSESTTENYTLRENFHDVGPFNGSGLTFVFSRYDIDRTSYSSGGTSSIFNLRSDTRNWTFTTRYKAFALLSYNTSYNKVYYQTRSGTTRSLNDTKSNTDRIGLQLNIVPFKFITNINYARTAKKSNTTSISGAVSTSSLSAAPRETQLSLSFIYYINQDRKLTLELEDYDKEYRALVSAGRGYDEQIMRLGYSLEF